MPSLVHLEANLSHIVRQGGMGVYISTPFLAQSVALAGGIGTVSGAMADRVLAEILREGDPGGHFTRALSHFPFPLIAERVLARYSVIGDEKKARPAIVSMGMSRDLIELILCANFALVWLAKEGHDFPIAINYLEKVQMPLVFGIAGAMLAGVDQVTIGAGIPLQVAQLLDKLAAGKDAHYHVHVEDSDQGGEDVSFSLSGFLGTNSIELKRPDFFPIVSVHTLAEILLKRSRSSIQGFVIENYTAGGHNAPPRGKFSHNSLGEPIYSERDIANLERMTELGYPFWLAGGYASPQMRIEALSCGASGIQVGSIFALSSLSGVQSEIRKETLRQFRIGVLSSIASATASPTGFPFRVVDLKGTPAERSTMLKRPPCCDIGALLTPYRTRAGFISYRCPAEPISNFERKGGDKHRTEGVTCLCNGLFNTSVLGKPGSPATLTLGSDLSFLNHLTSDTKPEYSVEEAMQYLLS